MLLMELGYDLEQGKEEPDMQDLVQLQQYYYGKMNPKTTKKIIIIIIIYINNNIFYKFITNHMYTMRIL